MEQKRTILIRAKTAKQAKKFAMIYRKLGTIEYLPETILKVKLNKKSGLAGGIKGYNVTLRRKKDIRKRTKTGALYKQYIGRKPRL